MDFSVIEIDVGGYLKKSAKDFWITGVVFAVFEVIAGLVLWIVFFYNDLSFLYFCGGFMLASIDIRVSGLIASLVYAKGEQVDQLKIIAENTKSNEPAAEYYDETDLEAEKLKKIINAYT